MGKVYNISFECNFIACFTKKILEITDQFQNPNNALIILPHKRLKHTFLQQEIFCASKSILLPKTITFTSIGENILEFNGFCKDLSEFVIHSLEKKLITNDQLTILLTLIIEELKGESLEFDVDFLDTLKVEQLKKAILECYHYQYDLSKIFPYSKKEKILLKALKKLEAYLEIEGLSLKAAFLNKAISEIVKKWDHNATGKIFAILPQTNVKYISLFLDNLARYKNAFIFIRGLDRELHQDKKAVNKTHHQYHIVDFLNRNRIMREVETISSLQAYNSKCGNPSLYQAFSGLPRSLPLSRDDENLGLLPHDSKSSELSSHDNELHNSNNINIISAKDQNEEARIISLIIREQLAKGLKNIVIQTKSIDLAVKIETFLKFWNIDTDNLLHKPYKNDQEIMLFLMVGHYLNLMENDYLLLLDILKSKHCKFHDKDELKEFEIHYLRKYSFRENVRDYFKGLETAKQEKFLFLLELEQKIIVARQKFKTCKKDLYEYLQIHLEVFSYLKKDYQNTSFRQLLLFMEKNFKILKHDASLKFSTYIKILTKSLHPHLFMTSTSINCPVRILQVLETRNIQYDMLIFAGLNEGIFPDVNLDHRYFHPYTRVANKLKSFDIEIGLMEYDFVSSLFNRRVVLSYSISLNTQSAKCRWLEKILTSKRERQKSELYTQKYRHWLQSLFYKNNKKRADMQYVNIDVNLRPNQISVSGIEKLILNPYVYYAKHILKLNYIEDIARHAGKRDLGIILHDIISKLFYKDFSDFEQYANQFNSLFTTNTKKCYIPFKIKKLWSVRLENIIRSTYSHICKSNVLNTFNEISGKMYLKFNSRQICVSCIADSIAITKENKLQILDYKTGYIPTVNEVRQGLYPQLAIEKLILLNRGFKEITHFSDDIALLYLDVSGKLINKIEIPIAISLIEAESGVKRLLKKFLCNKNEFFIVTDTQKNRKFGEYKYFARVLKV